MVSAVSKQIANPINRQMEALAKQNTNMIQLIAAMEKQIADLSKQKARRPSAADTLKQVHERT